MDYSTLEQRGIIINTRDLVEKMKLPSMTFICKESVQFLRSPSAYLALFSKALNL